MTISPSVWPFSLWMTPPDDRETRTGFRILLVACWMMSATCWSLARTSLPLDLGAFDWVAILKTVLRGAALLLAISLLLKLNYHPRSVSVLRRLIPFGVFSIWATVSTLWSPMKIVTLGHALEAVTLVSLAICAGILVDSDARRSALCLNLLLPFLLMVGFILIAEFHTIWNGQRPITYMHPNSLGALSVTALILLLACHFFFTWPWTHKLILPGSAICVIGIYVARSRSALLGGLLVVTVLLWMARRRNLIFTILAGAGIILALMPYAQRIEEIPHSVQNYVLRGQTTEDLAGASGRDELWARAFEAFKESPILGNGYFMISSSGTLYVWLKTQYQTAHSLYLHVLTGTGIVGAVLFLWACTAAIGPSLGRLKRNWPAADILFLSLTVWFALVGFFELSILGPVDPGGVLFFAIMGATVQPLESSTPLLRLEATACAS
jgi:O-antigen ligase